ncbi:MutS-related protein [Reichenbachiella ulvae]|uniref:DNA mismatch repair proteins mutS family domain-containing protein n=1 Tax=Reichenbachiella ulvae TaxID=2980104 RepID=A0ABT3CW78_9BACT|nr:hypothetical protein [Reichenbachiella ulvae]MCV9387971.1 hypothetical protein [Reichenbachiella ulvae]
MSTKKDFFQARAEKFQAEAVNLKSTAAITGWARVLSFVIVAVLVVYLINDRELMGAILTLLAYVPVFGFLVKKHNQQKHERDIQLQLTRLNQEEILRLERKLKELPDSSAYLDMDHSYAPDLDIFGRHALFQLINRNELQGSKDLLAKWLSQPANAEEIKARQEAVKELAPQTDWNQLLSAHSAEIKEKKKESLSISQHLDIIKRDTQVMDKGYWTTAKILLPLFALGIIIAISAFELDYRWIFLPVAINTLFLRAIFSPLLELTKEMPQLNRLLSSYEYALTAIEKQDFQSTLLLNLQSRISNGTQASASIAQLKVSLDFLTNRGNLIYGVLNSLFALDLLVLGRIKNWYTRHHQEVGQWLEVVEETSVLADMASFTFAEASYIFPQVKDIEGFEASEMKHPLLPADVAVANDFGLKGKGQLALITGSNMSGKSTFLRTLGVNLVLAQMGAPIAAQSLSFTPLHIFTSMRTQDNLEESVSSFYAEIRRIKQLLDQLSGEQTVLYLLDEILKGTNTKDRHAGAIALINQLTQSNCLGLISTHDVELAELSNDHMTNYSFNSQLENDEINFDYRLTDGPCKSFNASALMRQMGIIQE